MISKTELDQAAGSYPIRDVFQRFYPEYLAKHHDLPEHKQKVAACSSKGIQQDTLLWYPHEQQEVKESRAYTPP